MDLFSQIKPTGRVGQDGFSWWIGQIEGTARDEVNNKGGYRFKVRIIGDHPKDPEIVSTADLPWANVMMPVNVPFLPGNTGGAHPQLQIGCWVIGFYLDHEKQKPIIIGSVGQTPGATTVTKVGRPGDAMTFETYINTDQLSLKEVNKEFQYEEWSGGPRGDFKTQDMTGGLGTGATKKINPIFETTPLPATWTDISRKKWCATVGQVCDESERNFGTKAKIYLAEFLNEVQKNNGNIGTYYVNQVTGGLYDGIYATRKYVNKFMSLIRALTANIKGYVSALLAKAVKKLIKALLYPSKKGNALTPVTEWINNMLANLGCKMADLGDRLAQWLTNVLMSYVESIYRAAACQIDELIGGILSKIASLLEELLADILGPLQTILSAIAAPFNIIGNAINYVLKLLGIECSGPDLQCSEYTKTCTDGTTDDGTTDETGDEDNEPKGLDKLLEQIENAFGDTAADYTQYVCEDAYKGKPLLLTTVGFTGGVRDTLLENNIIYDINNIEVEEGNEAIFTVTRKGRTDVASSVSYKNLKKGSATVDEDYLPEDGILGFLPNEIEKTITFQTLYTPEKENDEYFYVKLEMNSPSKESGIGHKFIKNIGRCKIKEEPISEPTDPYIPPITDPFAEIDKVFPPDTTDTVPGEGIDNDPNNQIGTQSTWSVISDKVIVKEGEFIIYAVTTSNVANGTVAYYQLTGNGITQSDIVGGQLQGEFVINNNSAAITVGIEEDTEIEDEETLTFTIHGKGATCDVLITAPTDQDLPDFDQGEGDTPDTDPGKGITPPVVDTGDIITDDNGSIIHIPVKNPGTAYKEPPFVFVGGNGIGATALGLLDNEGFLTEIRVLTGGYGYKKNLASGNNKRCIIDSFTVTRPGQGYTTQPDVYVNGQKGVAEAIINDDGFVIGARVLDRALTFERMPEIRVIGTTGSGAKMLPSLVCLGTDALAEVGATKIGTGRYVDCP